MRCRECEYSLWNLKARQCPECGSAFLPSEYEFIKHTVSFCCPHCDKAYYGTDECGLLVPREFDCVGCSKRISMDEMVLRPAEGYEDRQTETDKNPWAESKGGGHFTGWFQTVWRAMVTPHRVLTATSRKNATGKAWMFAFVTSIVITLGVAMPYMLFAALFAVGIAGAGAGGGGGGVFFGLLMFAGISVLVVVGFVAFNLLGIAMWSGCAHLLLKWTGPIEGTIGRTMQAICYSSGANIATAIPCLGGYFGWIWWAVSAVFMIRDAQRVSGARATFAAMTFPVLSVVIILGSYVGLIVFATQMGTTYQTMQIGRVNATASVSRLSDSIQMYASMNGGRLPRHAAELIPAGNAEPLTFVVAESATMPYRIMIGTRDLQSLGYLPVNEVDRVVASAADELPDDVIAHRLGDFVFCWHGMNFTTASGELWLFITAKDIDYNGETDIRGNYIVGRIDGTTERIAIDEWDPKLDEQNALRSTYGLPPLPHPDRVRHGCPASAP